ncbi:hypothetical protein OTK49_21335 [Vibrio coralliirubri]|uniref:hypothetical protein n=1 Tax=Vibrio coralliirubri TaxID=1516159 RepID=UPI0022841570|nr:hypothetical protein [Vibrio coralliirubri]MCY9865065.1 hypothetical protein [Vibrio coralliirubri]
MINPFKRNTTMLRRKSKFIHNLLKIELISSSNKPAAKEIEQCLRSYYLAAMGLNHAMVSEEEQDEHIELALSKNHPWLDTYDNLVLKTLFKRHGIKSEQVRNTILHELKTTFHFKDGVPPYQPYTAYCGNTVHNLQIDNANVAGVVYGDSMAQLYREAVDLNLDDLCNGQGSVWLLKDLETDKLAQFMIGRGVPKKDIIKLSDAAPSKEYSFLVRNSGYYAMHTTLVEIVFLALHQRGVLDTYQEKTNGFNVLHCTLRHVFKLAIEHNEPTLLAYPTLAAFIELSKKHDYNISVCLGEALGIDPELIFPDFEPLEEHYERWGMEYMWVFEILKELRPILGLGGRCIYDTALGLKGEDPKHFLIDFSNPLAHYAAVTLFHIERQNRNCDEQEVRHSKGKRCPVFVDQKMLVEGLFAIPEQFATKFFALHVFFGEDFMDFESSLEQFSSARANASHYVVSSLNPFCHYDNKILEFLRDEGGLGNNQLYICKGE